MSGGPLDAMMLYFCAPRFAVLVTVLPLSAQQLDLTYDQTQPIQSLDEFLGVHPFPAKDGRHQ